MMSSRNLLNLVLLVVVAALVAVVIIKPGKQVTPVVKLTDLSQSAITRIEIRRNDSDPKVVLARQDGNWQMLEPYKMPANAFKAQAITELAEAVAKASYPITPGEDLKPFGLDKPQLTVVLNGKVRLQFGTTEPLNFQRYIREGNTLYLIFDSFFYNLSVPPTEFVDHALLPPGSTISQLELPNLSLTPAGDGWQATPPVKDLSNDQVNELFERWSMAQASEVQTYKPGKVSEQARVYLKGQAQPLVFDVLHEDQAIAFGRADLGLQYKFTPDTGKPLLELPPKINATLPKAPAHSVTPAPPAATPGK